MDIEQVAITSLSPHPRNYRAHPAEQLSHLEASLAEYGWARNVVVSSDNVILAGHGIVEAARRRGETEVPVHRLALPSTDPKAEKFLVLENEVSRLADDDGEQLAALLADIQRTDGLEGTGYDDAALDALIGELAKQDRANAPLEDPGPEEPPVEPVTKLGDVWLMGEHRLVCGDCTDGAAWEAALGGAVPDMVFTDPPYGVGFQGSSVETKAIAGDDVGIENWIGFVGQVPPDTPLYICCDFRSYPALFFALKAAKRPVAECIVWDKTEGKENVQVPLGALDRWIRSTEFVAYCGKLNEQRGYSANVIHYARVYGASSLSEQDELVRAHEGPLMELHPTIKPLAVVGKCLGAHETARRVFDPFLGSGTTLIAAEQLGRVCYGIEIEPRYVDVAVRRWCKATGRTATLESTGEPFPMPAPEGA